MYSRIRAQFAPTALILSILAIVFAMLGAAYAASNNDSGKATASAKGKQGPRGPRGKPGKPGPAGPVGPVGPQGSPGANGKDGANGQNGTNGKDGEPGKSVEINPADGIVQCEDVGGILVKVEGEAGEGKEVCNGEKGEKGEKGDEGSPWTELGTLPPEKTESGTWSFTGNEDTGEMLASISFPIPLSAVLGEEAVHFWGEAGFEDSCPSEAIPNPEAEPGALCVYYNENDQNALFNATLTGIYNATDLETQGAARTGAILGFEFDGATGEVAHGFGTWAVTAPPAP